MSFKEVLASMVKKERRETTEEMKTPVWSVIEVDFPCVISFTCSQKLLS